MNPVKSDVFRDTPIRYLGYANEIGEAFRSLIKKKYVHLSYGVAITYVLCDAGDKAWKRFQRDGIVGASKSCGDVLLWQMLASVAIPGFTINRICWASTWLIKSRKLAKGQMQKWIPTCIGLLSIPLIITPIDKGVDHLMDHTYRKMVA